MNNKMKYNFKNYLRNSLAGVLLTATALSASHTPSSQDEPMRRAFTAMDLLDMEQKDSGKGGSSILDLYRLESIFHNSGRQAYYEAYKGLDRTALQAVAETQLMTALEAGSPFAAYHLFKFYCAREKKSSIEDLRLDRGVLSSLSQETKERGEKILLEAIRIKQQKGIRSGVAQDIDLLVALNGITTKSISGIRQIEAIDPISALSFYGYLATNLEQAETDAAFEALKHLSELPQSWVSLGHAFIVRKMFEEGIDFFEKSLSTFNSDSGELWLLKSIIEQNDNPFDVRLRATRLRQLHATKLNTSDGQFEAYNNYRTLLKEIKDRSAAMQEDLFHVSSAMARIANESLKETPSLLFQLAFLYSEEAVPGTDMSSIIDMFKEAADHGCRESLDKLVTFEPFLEGNRVNDATLFFVSHGSIAGLSALHQKTNNDVFLVMIERLKERNQNRRHESDSSDAELLNDSYVLALDLKILKLEEQVNKLAAFIHDTEERIYYAFDYYCQKSISIFLDAYNNAFIKFDSKNFANEYVDGIKKRKSVLEDEIKAIKTRQDEILRGVSAKELYGLAQEYHLLHQAEETLHRYSFSVPTIFLNGFLSILGKAADQGYLPAVEGLVDFYSKGEGNSSDTSLSSISTASISISNVEHLSEKAAFYERMRTLLKDESLSLLEKIARFEALMKEKSF